MKQQAGIVNTSGRVLCQMTPQHQLVSLAAPLATARQCNNDVLFISDYSVSSALAAAAARPPDWSLTASRRLALITSVSLIQV